jgi:hypothetical protein
VGASRGHAGATAAFVEEAFEKIQLDDAGIAAVRPRGAYVLLAALAADPTMAGMEMVGETGFEPAAS